MKKNLLVLAGMLASAQVFAQAENFSGFSVGLNTGFNTEIAKWNTDTTTTDSTIELGHNNTPFDINLSYSIPLSTNGILSVGLNYDLTQNKITDGGVSTSIGLTSKIKNHYSLNLEPGYAFSDSTLGYVKLAYHSAKASASFLSKNITGFGYGVGTKYLVDKNLYLSLELQKVVYNNVSFTSGGDSMTMQIYTNNATIGIGYKF